MTHKVLYFFILFIEKTTQRRQITYGPYGKCLANIIYNVSSYWLGSYALESVFGIRIRKFLGLLDQDPLVKATDPDPDPPIIKQK